MIDYISREAAIEEIRVAAGCADCDGKSDVIYSCAFCDVYNAIRLIESFPAADVEPVRHGRWLDCEAHNDIEQCSECGMIFSYPSYYRYKFFPNCGAKMELEDDNG